jgi:hypothetical protein
MIIKLTNASKEYDGEPLLINTRHILSAFSTEDIREVDGVKEIKSVTSIYTVTQQSWIVEEPVKELYKMVQGCHHE